MKGTTKPASRPPPVSRQVIKNPVPDKKIERIFCSYDDSSSSISMSPPDDTLNNRSCPFSAMQCSSKEAVKKSSLTNKTNRNNNNIYDDYCQTSPTYPSDSCRSISSSLRQEELSTCASGSTASSTPPDINTIVEWSEDGDPVRVNFQKLKARPDANDLIKLWHTDQTAFWLRLGYYREPKKAEDVEKPTTGNLDRGSRTRARITALSRNSLRFSGTVLIRPKSQPASSGMVKIAGSNQRLLSTSTQSDSTRGGHSSGTDR